LIKSDELVPGEPYPGDAGEGRLYSKDTQGNISDEQGNMVLPNDELRKILESSKKKGGRFRVTTVNSYVVELEKTVGGWRGLYLGRLTGKLELAEPPETDATHKQYSPGDPYPLGRARGKTFSVLQRDRRLIATKTRGGVRFVKDAKILDDSVKRSALTDLQTQLAKVYARGHRINKITVTEEGHVVYVFNNEAFFVGVAPEGGRGFDFEEEDGM
jgi:hypothetical protein